MSILQDVLRESTTKTWLEFLTPLMIALSGAVTIFFQNYFQKRNSREADKRSLELNKKVDAVATTSDQTRTFVNGVHGTALKTVYQQAVKIAELTQAPEDIEKAKAAKKTSDQHEAQQTAMNVQEDKRQADQKTDTNKSEEK